MRSQHRLTTPGLDVTAALGFRVWRKLDDKKIRMDRAHSHADLELNFITRGQLTYAYGGQFVTLRPGDFAVFWGSVPHQGIDGETPVCGVWATFTLPMLLHWKLPGGLAERLLKGEFVRISLPPEQAKHEAYILERWAREMLGDSPAAQHTVRLELEARMRRLAGEAPAQGKPRLPPEPGIERALAFLNQHYREEIRAADVASASGWHEKYLMRAFKRTTLMPMGEYLLRLRIAHAQWLLLRSDKSMLEVAYESGFQSAAPFYQAFRRVLPGVTPLQFRKQAAKQLANT